MVRGEARVGLGSGRIPLTVSVGDGDAPARGCLCPILAGNIIIVFHGNKIGSKDINTLGNFWAVFA